MLDWEWNGYDVDGVCEISGRVLIDAFDAVL